METTRLVLKIAQACNDGSPFAAQIGAVLALAGTALNAGRAYVCMEKPDGTGRRDAFEWCATGIPANRERLLDDPFDSVPEWAEALQNAESVIADDISALPPAIERRLKSRRVRSFAAFALSDGRKRPGFVAFDECLRSRAWTGEEIELMRIVAAIAGIAYGRETARAEALLAEKNCGSFFEANDDLFLIAEMSGRIMHANAAALRKLGYTIPELRRMSLPDVYEAGDTDERERIHSAMIRGERALSHVALKPKSGDAISAETRVWTGLWNGKECYFSLSRILQ